MSDPTAPSVRQIERDRANGHGRTRKASSATDRTSDHARRELSPAQADLAQLVVQELRDNCRLNFRVRAGLAVLGLTTGVVVLVCAVLRGDDIAAAAQGGGSLGAAVAASIPVLVLLALAIAVGGAAWTVHQRGLDEMYNTLEAVSRMEREGEVAVSSRGLIHAFEEKLQNTRRAFTVLLWLGRTLFLVCLGLAGAAILSLILKGDPVLTGALGGSSLIGALLGAARKVPRNISHHLADVIQIQTAVTGCDRQISLLETAAIDIVNFGEDRTQTHADVLAVQQRMDEVVSNAVRRIERYADPEFRADRVEPPAP
jgi:hypothetical protein